MWLASLGLLAVMASAGAILPEYTSASTHRGLKQRRVYNAAAPAKPQAYGPQPEKVEERLETVQPLRVSISCYDEMLQQLESGQVFNTWIECENTSGFPATSRHRDKHARDAGTHMLPMEDAPSTAPELAPLPVRPTVVSKKPRYPPDSEEIKALSAEIEKHKSWTTLMVSSDEYDPIGVISEAMANSAASDAAGCATGGRAVVLDAANYGPTLRAVFALGRTVYVDEEGRPHLRGLEPIGNDTSFKVKAWKRGATGIGFEDLEAVWSLTYGWRYNSEPAMLCSITPNYEAATEYLNPEEYTMKMSEAISTEVEQGWMLSSDFPRTLPSALMPQFLVIKPTVKDGKIVPRGWRRVADATLDGNKQRYTGIDGEEKLLGPNKHYMEDSPEFSYSSLSIIANAVLPMQALAVAMSIAAGEHIPLEGKTYDFLTWFRQLAICTMDQWQVGASWQGKYLTDVRLTMGTAGSSKAGQRTSFLAIAIAERDLMDGLPAFLEENADAPWMPGFLEWRDARLRHFNGDERQAVPWSLNTFQDDTPTITPKPFGAFVNKSLHGTFDRLGADCSPKEGEFATRFVALGGDFNLERTVEFPWGSLGPAETAMVALSNDLTHLNEARAKGEEPALDRCRSLEGRLEWCANFHVKGPGCALPAHRAMAHARRAHSTHAFVSGSFIEETTRTLDDLKEGKVLALVRNPTYLHMGSVGASDASTTDGWGTHSGNMVAYGLWDSETIAAIQRSKNKETDGEKISISPLELLTVALQIIVTMETHEETIQEKWKALGQSGNPQLFMRCDNQSAVDVLESRRAHTPSMRASLAIVQEVEEVYGVFVRLEHIASEDNIIADALSHANMEIPGKIFDEAKAQMCMFSTNTFLPRINGSLQKFAQEGECKVRTAILSQA